SPAVPACEDRRSPCRSTTPAPRSCSTVRARVTSCSKGGAPGGRHRNTTTVLHLARAHNATGRPENFRAIRQKWVLTCGEIGEHWTYTRTPDNESAVDRDVRRSETTVLQDLARPPASQSRSDSAATTALPDVDGDYRGLLCVGVSAVRVLVTGATGYVGRAVVSALRTRGHEPVALVRTPGARVADAAEIRVADLLDVSALRRALAGGDRPRAADPDGSATVGSDTAGSATVGSDTAGSADGDGGTIRTGATSEAAPRIDA